MSFSFGRKHSSSMSYFITKASKICRTPKICGGPRKRGAPDTCPKCLPPPLDPALILCSSFSIWVKCSTVTTITVINKKGFGCCPCRFGSWQSIVIIIARFFFWGGGNISSNYDMLATALHSTRTFKKILDKLVRTFRALLEQPGSLPLYWKSL